MERKRYVKKKSGKRLVGLAVVRGGEWMELVACKFAVRKRAG